MTSKSMRMDDAVERATQPDYMHILKLDEEELKRRLAFFELSQIRQRKRTERVV